MKASTFTATLTLILTSVLHTNAKACKAPQQSISPSKDLSAANVQPSDGASHNSNTNGNTASILGDNSMPASLNSGTGSNIPGTFVGSSTHTIASSSPATSTISLSNKQKAAASVAPLPGTPEKTSANSIVSSVVSSSAPSAPSPTTLSVATNVVSITSSAAASGTTAQQAGDFGMSVTAGPNILSYNSGTTVAGGETFSVYTRIYTDSTYDAGVYPPPNAESEREWQTAFSAFNDAEGPSCQVPTWSVTNGVAISTALMSRTFVGGKSIFCGQKLTLKIAGNATGIPATVVDSCGACSPVPFGRVDLTPNAAKAMVAGGFVDGVHWGSWTFDDPKYGALWAELAPKAEQIPVPGSPTLGQITDRSGIWIPAGFQA